MGFWGKSSKIKRHQIEDSESLLSALARKRGLFGENGDPMLAWAVFKEFCLTYPFQCEDDAVLWEIGPYGVTDRGERCFQWHLVRQFVIGSGEDDDMTQVYLDMDFPEESGEGKSTSLWSYDLNGDFGAFFAAIEARPEFQIIRNKILYSVRIGLDNV